MVRTCVTCKFSVQPTRIGAFGSEVLLFNKNNHNFDKCTHYVFDEDIDLVTGKHIDHPCYKERSPTGSCGPNGVLWENKYVTIKV